jgi:hypothetical protein
LELQLLLLSPLVLPSFAVPVTCCATPPIVAYNILCSERHVWQLSPHLAVSQLLLLLLPPSG